MQHPDINMPLITICTTVSLGNLYLYCYYGKLVTDNYLLFADYAYEINWYKLSPDLQKIFILIISNSQQPLYYNGFGIMNLKLETLTGVSITNMV